MATLRLNKTMREELFSYAKTLISFPEDDKAAKDAAELAEKLVRELIQNALPAEDRKVLEKYRLLEPVYRIHLRNSIGVDRWYEFDRGRHDNGNWIADKNLPTYLNRYHTPALIAPDEVFAAIENATFTKDQRDKNRRQLENDYQNLINSVRTFDELVELWPEAEVMRSKYETRVASHAVSCISLEALERIKNDVATRKAA